MFEHIIIADVHGYIDTPNKHGRSYCQLIKKAKSSTQLGDFGLNSEPLNTHNIRADLNRIIGGNHDNYADLSKHYLGDYGQRKIRLSNDQTFDYFYIRGAESIDRNHPLRRNAWFPQEEISQHECANAIEAYSKVQPSFMITHDCPGSVAKQITGRLNKNQMSRTQRMLQFCFDAHQPAYWIFGHYHRTVVIKIGKTTFMCLNELEYIPIHDTWPHHKLTVI